MLALHLLLPLVAFGPQDAKAGTQPISAHDRPGSLLLFCEYDDRPGNRTLLTVTNTDDSDSAGIRVHFNYIDGDDCLVFDRTEFMTPGDTLTVLTAFHNPRLNRGYVYVYAEDQQTQAEIVHNHLVGSAIQLTSLAVFDYSYNAIAYQGVGPDGAPTDVDDDGVRDLDGVEYSGPPDEVMFPRFLGVGFLRPVDLVLVNLTGGVSFTTTLQFLIWNDNEEIFSAQYQFDCWARVPLSTITGAFKNDFLASTGHDPDEVVGAPHIESGWFRIDGLVATSQQTQIPDPAFNAMLVEGASSFKFHGGLTSPFFVISFSRSDTALLPFYEGTQSNGALLPSGVIGVH